MAQPQPSPNLTYLTGNVLNTFSVTPIYGGDSEDISVLAHFKKSVLQFLRDVVARDAIQGYDKSYPENWKVLLRIWVKPNSKAAELLERPDFKDPSKFCDTLIARKTKTSEKFSLDLRTFLIALSLPASMDAHTKTIVEFAISFFDKFVLERYTIRVGLDFDTSMAPLQQVAGWKAPFTLSLEACKVAFVKKAVESMKEEFVSIFHRHFMLAMVSADTRLWNLLDSNQQPLAADPSDLANWIQTKMLDPESFNIFLTLTGQSPLIKASGFGKPSNPSGGGGGSSTITSPHPGSRGNPQPTPTPKPASQGNKPNPKKTGAPSGGGGGSNKVAKTATGTTPSAGGGGGGTGSSRRFCHFCYNAKLVCANGQPSVSHTRHDDAYCQRNPTSPRFDANYAKLPPTN